jgi:uncharacterized membrane protein (DUF106 family)
MKNNILQAYKQAPWRVQLQYIGLFLLGLVLISAIMGIYLSISSQAATAGRRIQSLENDMDEINNEIAELTTTLAQKTSAEVMQSRAEAMGFQMMNVNRAFYLEILGFDPKADLVLAPPMVNVVVEAPILREAYKTTLWDWFMQQVWYASTGFSSGNEEVSP